MSGRPKTIDVGGGGRALAAIFVSVMILSVIAIGTAPAAAEPTGEINYGEDAADPIWIDVDTLTVAKHPMDEGASHAAMAGYYDDNGEWIADPVFVVNSSIGEDVESDELGNRNPYTFNPAYIEDDDFAAFPRRGDDEDDDDTDAGPAEDNLASALDASEWSETANSSYATPADTTIAANVDAANFDTGSSIGAGDYYTVEYSNWTSELDADESKRVLQLSGEVNSIESGTRAYINVEDESGDTKTVEINGSSSASTSDQDTVATSTGTFFAQVKLEDLTTTGGGSWDNIEKIELNVTDGDLDVSFSRIDLEKKGKDVYGVKVVDDDDDDSDYDNTEEIENGTGTINVESMDTLGAEFDDATITDVQFPAKFRVQDLKTEGDEDDYHVSWSTSSKYTRPNVLTAEYRLELPDAIDLSYSGTSLEIDQAWPSDRYVELGLVEGSDGEKFTSHEDDDDYTDKLGDLGAEDEEVTLDSTVSSGTEYVLRVVATFSDTERSSIESAGPAGSSGGSGGFWSGSGNPLTMIATIAASVFAIVMGALGLRNRGG